MAEGRTGGDRAGGRAGGRRPADITRRTYQRLLLTSALAGVWLTRHGLVAAVPAGDDVEAHVARTDFAFHLFGQGRLDGWFPTFGSGYRLFAVYGPGLAMASGLVRLATFGTLDTARSLAVLGSLSIALVPVAVATLSRELGASRLAATVHGALALFVSFPFGGGLAALYGPGLVPQVLAVPIQVLALAGVLRTFRTGSRRAVAATALAVGWLLVLHPISLLILGVMAPGLLLAIPPSSHRGQPRPGARETAHRPWRNLGWVALAGAWGAAVAAWWLIPAWRTRDLRGGVSAWPTRTLLDRLATVVRGETLVPQVLALAAVAALAVLLGRAVHEPAARRLLAAPVTALVYLVLAHAAAGRRWGPAELRIQFANRGLVLAAFLLLLPLAIFAADVAVRHLPRERLTLAAAVTVVVLGLLAPVLLRGSLSPRQSAPPASADLVATARAMRSLEPPGRRHLLVDPSPFVPLGTSEPARWLAVAAHRPTAHLYFPEATTSPAAGLLPGRIITEITPADSLGRLRRAGITHIVVTAPIPANEVDGVSGYRRVARDGTLAIYEVQPETGAPTVAAMLQPDDKPIRPIGFRLDASLRRRTDEHLAWDVRASDPTDVVVPVAWDPDWHVTVDGRPVAVHRSDEQLLGFTVPSGRHQVELAFTGSRNDPVGILLSLVAMAAAVWVTAGGAVPSSPWGRGRAGRPAGRPPARRSDPSSA